jgi:hypothetical protein
MCFKEDQFELKAKNRRTQVLLTESDKYHIGYHNEYLRDY